MIPNYRVKEPIIPLNPPVYHCKRALLPFGKATGCIDRDFWKNAEIITEFRDIEGDTRPRPWKKTVVRMLWDEEALYVGAVLEEDEIWATVKNRDELIFTDNDFEVFLAPQASSHRYYELEMNALNTVWDLLMEKPQRDRVRRIIGWDIKGLDSAVRIDGELNNPNADNRSWSLEIKIPWFSLRECGLDQCYPEHWAPDVGEIWRLNFSRVTWNVDKKNGAYVKRTDASGKPLPENNWVWAPTGVIDIHMPEMWGYLLFTQAGEDYPLPKEDAAKWLLRRVYYREHLYSCTHNCFTEDLQALFGDEAQDMNVNVYTTPSLFEAITEFGGTHWHIRQDGYIWQDADEG